MGSVNRDEYLAWAKERALVYLDRGDLGGAMTSLGSDLSQHAELGLSDTLAQVGLMYLINHDTQGLRRWIEGFR